MKMAFEQDSASPNISNKATSTRKSYRSTRNTIKEEESSTQYDSDNYKKEFESEDQPESEDRPDSESEDESQYEDVKAKRVKLSKAKRVKLSKAKRAKLSKTRVSRKPKAKAHVKAPVSESGSEVSFNINFVDYGNDNNDVAVNAREQSTSLASFQGIDVSSNGKSSWP